MSDTHNSSGTNNMRNAATVEELQAALAESHADNKKLRETAQRMNAQMAALTEENEALRKERDSYKEQLEALQEQHATELREVTEEMAAAARFSDNEWREHCDRVEAEGRRLRSVIAAVTATALELLLRAEAAARHELEEEEEAGREAFPLAAYRSAVAAARAFEVSASVGADAPPASADSEQSDESPANKLTIEQNALIQISLLCRALDCTRVELNDKYLGKARKEGSNSWYNTSAQARGLWELYRTLYDVGFSTDAAIAKLLETENQVNVLCFNAFGHGPDYGEFNYAIPPTANAYDFFHRLLRQLPELGRLCFSHLPPLSSPGALEVLAGAARILEVFALCHTDYTVADLLTLHKSCPELMHLYVHVSHCTDWGEYATIADMEERKRRVDEACGGIIAWNNE